MSQITKTLTSGGPIPPIIPTSFVTDNGTAIPAANIININGGPGVQVIANPNGSNNILVNITDEANAYTNVTNAMSPYSVTASDFFISVDATAGPVVINLLASPGNNREYVVKDRLGQAAINVITINTQGGDTIDGAASYVFSDAYESVDMLFHGTNYEVF